MRGDRAERPEPRTEAERRAAEVRATRGPRRTEITPETERAKIEAREIEEWVDEGSLRDEAAAAIKARKKEGKLDLGRLLPGWSG